MLGVSGTKPEPMSLRASDRMSFDGRYLDTVAIPALLLLNGPRAARR